MSVARFAKAKVQRKKAKRPTAADPPVFLLPSSFSFFLLNW
jgi:hypothetical protein